MVVVHPERAIERAVERRIEHALTIDDEQSSDH
jgi:hypothetical protein